MQNETIKNKNISKQRLQYVYLENLNKFFYN